MAALSFQQAVDRFKQDENKEVAALVLHDKALQAILACWPQVPRDVPRADTDVDGLSLDALWNLIRYSERDIADYSGLSTGQAIMAFRRARGNRLIYPDGSVHQLARGVLQKMIKDTLTAPGKKTR